MLCTQYLASALTQRSPPRLSPGIWREPSKRDSYHDWPTSSLTILKRNIKRSWFLKQIHSAAVEAAIQVYPNSKIVDASAPCISEEKQLPRAFCTNLSRLRSGYCR